MRVLALTSTLVAVVTAGGCASRAAAPTRSTPPAAAATPALDGAHENLHAVLWVQTAIEYQASALQAYQRARQQLDAALADPSWTAALEQTGDVAPLPPAIVLDLDETVVDNSPFQARAIAVQLGERAAGRQAEGFDAAAWDAWCAEARAGAVPGAVEFLRYARSRGVTPFFVSNRTGPLEAATRRNLAGLGIEVGDATDTVLLRNERPEWAASDKTARRAAVARTHRILLLVGDDLGDFTTAEGTVQARAERLAPLASRWGTSWIVIPNPMYGSWERAILAAPGVGTLGKKIAALDPKS
jgi:acid phosphatase